MPGQTLSQIRSHLAAAGLAPRHRYGQNFLIDLNLMRKLVESAEVGPADTILEVGPGTGSLTDCLLDTGARVIAVEIDHGLQELLRGLYGEHPRFTLVQADVLAGKHQVNPLVLNLLQEQEPDAGGARKLVANLPYQVATPLLVDLLLADPPLERLVCTIQKEVGERLMAGAGDSAYGPVSVVCQTLAEVSLIAILPPAVFWPRPKIESVMLLIRPRPRDTLAVADPADFARFVQRTFAQRRKMLRRIVKDWDTLDAAAAFGRANINPDARPEQLTVQDWQAFHAAVRSQMPPTPNA